jgi:DNA polymerase-3 subunit alpha
LAHKGDTPVHIHVGERAFVLDRYPVGVTPMLLGELKSVPGITVA